MSEPPHRKRFQIHLSTAIVLMFVAGGLIGANVIPDAAALGLNEYGWPTCYLMRLLLGGSVEGSKSVFLLDGFLVDLTTVGFLLFDTWFVCEWLIRRRAVRSPKNAG